MRTGKGFQVYQLSNHYIILTSHRFSLQILSPQTELIFSPSNLTASIIFLKPCRFFQKPNRYFYRVGIFLRIYRQFRKLILKQTAHHNHAPGLFRNVVLFCLSNYFTFTAPTVYRTRRPEHKHRKFSM